MSVERVDLEWIREKVQDQKLGWKVREKPLGAVPPWLASGKIPPMISDERRRENLKRRDIALAVQKEQNIVFHPCPSIDWQDHMSHDYVTSPKDQGGCYSCTAFAVVAAVESNLAISRGKPIDQGNSIDLSEADLFFCPPRQLQSGETPCTSGMYIDDVLEKSVTRGICDESILTWSSALSRCQPCSNCGHDHRAISDNPIQNGSVMTLVDQAKEWICDKGPVIAEMFVFNDFIYGYGSGVYRPIQPDANGLGGSKPLYCHSVCIVGFADGPNNANDPTDGYWICKNSSLWMQTNPVGIFWIGFGECGMLSNYRHPDGNEYFFPFYGVEIKLSIPPINPPKVRYPFPLWKWKPDPPPFKPPIDSLK